MKLTRRGLLGGLLALPFVPKVLAERIHDWDRLKFQGAPIVWDKAPEIRPALKLWQQEMWQAYATNNRFLDGMQWTPDGQSILRRKQVDALQFNRIKP